MSGQDLPSDPFAAQDAYLRDNPGTARWQNGTKAAMARELRFGSGRRFFGPEGTVTERLNTPVQGTADDGAKRALALLRGRLPQYGARLVVFAHDQVLAPTPLKAARDLQQVVSDSMIKGMQPFVPIRVESNVQLSWSSKSVVPRVEGVAGTAHSVQPSSSGNMEAQ